MKIILIVGGITFSFIARVQANSSIAAVAPIRCPCIAFVEEIFRDLEYVPKTLLMASDSILSFKIVPVPCALI